MRDVERARWDDGYINGLRFRFLILVFIFVIVL